MTIISAYHPKLSSKFVIGLIKGNAASFVDTTQAIFYNCFGCILAAAFIFPATLQTMNSIATWIGLNDRGTEELWRWSSDKPYAYLNWAAGIDKKHL